MICERCGKEISIKEKNALPNCAYKIVCNKCFETICKIGQTKIEKFLKYRKVV
jgi:RNA polymerase-binding transcription factor DksA